MKEWDRNTEPTFSLVERIEQLDLSASDRRIAIENALRAERWAEIFWTIGAGIRGITDALVKLARRAGAAVSRGHSPRERIHS